VKGLARAVVVCAGAFVMALSSLLLARTHPFGDAGLYSSKHRAPGYGPSAIMEHSDVPPTVRDVLITKCADCHSAETRAPIYGRFAPISWLMERDIVKARKAMDLSLWEQYSAGKQETLQSEIVSQTKAHTMPPVQYRVIHWNATITKTDITALTDWARGRPLALSNSAGQVLTEGDALRGRDVFEKRCTGCHMLDQDGQGPRLRGVFGRTSGAVPGFDYSPALAKAHIVWNERTLEQWLADPDALVPDNNMESYVAKSQERRDLIRFLRDSVHK
jgi:cytochrome c